MSRGFTIIELMVVIAVVAVLATLAAPGMRDLVVGSRVRGASSDFYSALLTARSEAIKRRGTAVVQPAGGDWKAGWTVELAGNVFQTGDALPADIGIEVIPSSAAGDAISYGSNGRVSDGSQTVVFYVVSLDTIQPRCVSVEMNGLPRVRTDSNGVATDGCN